MHNSHSEIIASFSDAMREAGITPPDDIVGDGALHRFKIDGKLSGRYTLHLDGLPSGFYQDFRQGIKENWTFRGHFKPPTNAERRTFAIERQRQEAERKAAAEMRHNEASEKARFIWRNASPIAEQAQHPYLIKKSIKPNALRCYNGALVVPIYDENRTLVNLQFVQPDGTKRFLAGGKKKGCFSVIGKPQQNQPLLICEGWATGASLHEHAGLFVVVALDAGNLEPVALVVSRMFPAVEIVIAGDNDLSGTGQKAARVAAVAVGGKYIVPATPGHDWNDSLTFEVPRG